MTFWGTFGWLLMAAFLFGGCFVASMLALHTSDYLKKLTWRVILYALLALASLTALLAWIIAGIAGAIGGAA